VPRPRKPKFQLPAYVHHVRARGKDYYCYDPRRGTDGASGARRLPGTPHDVDFWREYRRLHGDDELGGKPRTIGALIEAYVTSPEFDKLAPKTADAYASRLEKVRKLWGDRLAAQIRSADVLKLRDDLAAERSAPNEWLREILAEIPRTSTHILTSALNRPWKKFGFSTAWQRTLGGEDLAAIRVAGLVFHGLRKSAPVKLAEAGCTDAEIAAITGQTRQMVEHYTRGVDQKRLTLAAIRKWEARDLG
jgi:hypothetical protein